MNEQIKKAVEILNKGGIVVFPTDTAFGIGCRVDDAKTVERLFNLRKRPVTKAMPVLIDSIVMAERYVQPIDNEVKERLIAPYWPGALTIVLSALDNSVSDLVRGGGKTIGLRIPNHPIALDLIREVGVGLATSSANFAGEPTPYSLEDVDKELLSFVDYLIPGECSLKQASTVIDCSVVPWKIVRKGTILIDTTEEAL